MRRSHTSTLSLLAASLFALRDHLTGDDTDPPKLSEQEWEEKKRADLSKKSHEQLVTKQVELERDLQKARAKAVPEGSRVLTADEAKEYEALTALGASKDVRARLEKGDAAVVTLAGRERGDTLREVAEAAGYKLPVLTRLAEGLTFEIGAEVEKDGKKSKPVTVKYEDGKKTAPLDKYAKEHWSDFEGSLRADASGDKKQQQQEQRRVTTGGAGAPQTKTAGDGLAAKRADTRYSM
ncbi:hypothetical protein [Deinococcus gobiensis]|uniref:Uncharacterized protein n=1 Tax=Deinococcus gobiensis (strain DSM 21396 / JCM 16679 / CGMCC 1.7299 / I-0) TaxID=745776 RepID=H8GXP4_DEIGI|nr:hypothetical protein [Deinococcus gobiensis]AFD25896.1 hypothetical protein DGo_CA1969 [Deinococcus gobiensis I-0]